jgi:hypothetical protein
MNIQLFTDKFIAALGFLILFMIAFASCQRIQEAFVEPGAVEVGVTGVEIEDAALVEITNTPVKVEPDAPTRVPQQGTPKGTLESQPTKTVPTGTIEMDEIVDENELATSNYFGWVEIVDPLFGFRFAAPCFWHVDLPDRDYRGRTISLRNYSYEYSLTFPRNDKDFWESGGIKIDIAFPKRMPQGILMEDYIAQHYGVNPDSKLISTEENVVNGQRTLLVTTESVFGIGQFNIFELDQDVFLIFNSSPGAHQYPDVQAILHSIALDPGVDIVLPDFSPGIPIEGVITDCMGANQLEALLAGPKSITWGDGEPVKVHFALVNLTDQELYTLNWFTPFEGIAGDIFRVERDGQPVPYHGILASRGDPSPDSILLIEPNGSIITGVNLSPVYDLSRPGTYTIAFKSPHSSYVARSEANLSKTLDELGPVIIPSNEITVEIVYED